MSVAFLPLAEGGVQLGGAAVFCDAPSCPPHATAFVSHAGVPFPRRADDVRLVTTERTRALHVAAEAWMGRARRRLRAATLVSPFGRPFALGRLRLELLPSGHLPGAAQLYVELEGRRVVYAGALNPAPGRFAERPQVRAAAAMLLDAPLCAFARALPPREEAEAALLAAVQRALDEKMTPIVLAPLFGAAADVVALLAEAGLPVLVHAHLFALLESYRRLGIAEVRARRFGRGPQKSEVVVWPLAAAAAAAIARLPRARRLCASGVALAPDAAARLGVDAAFALAEYGDLPSLVAYARAAGARDVWLARGFCEVARRAFAEAGVTAHPFVAARPMEQMALFLK